jgi:hypothetical protein
MKTVRIKLLKNRDALQAGRSYNLSEKAATFLIQTGRAELERPEETKPVGPAEIKPIQAAEAKPVGPSENKVKKNSQKVSKAKGF